MGNKGGMYGLACWNGLSEEQQIRLIEVGVLPIGYIPEGSCPEVATVEITTKFDKAPGPRFYCVTCAICFLAKVDISYDWNPGHAERLEAIAGYPHGGEQIDRG